MVLIRLAKFVTAGFLAVVPLAVLPPDAVADPNVSVLAFGLVGSQSVFESEAKGSAAILARQLGAGNVVARANTKTRGDVTIEAIKAAIQSAAAKMDREHDLLALILTSHGSPDGVAVQAGRRVETLSPSALARLLDGTGVRHRIVIISACYSGVFLGPLANDDSLVITAADSEHSSFGCQDKVKWTYFGDAFFNTALRHTADLRQAFDEARAIVRQRELRYHLVPSNPQIAGGKNIDILLGKAGGAEAFGRQP
jgi:Peptidase C13 family